MRARIQIFLWNVTDEFEVFREIFAGAHFSNIQLTILAIFSVKSTHYALWVYYLLGILLEAQGWEGCAMHLRTFLCFDTWNWHIHSRHQHWSSVGKSEGQSGTWSSQFAWLTPGTRSHGATWETSRLSWSPEIKRKFLHVFSNIGYLWKKGFCRRHLLVSFWADSELK